MDSQQRYEAVRELGPHEFQNIHRQAMASQDYNAVFDDLVVGLILSKKADKVAVIDNGDGTWGTYEKN